MRRNPKEWKDGTIPWLGQYILDENDQPVIPESMDAWADWIETHRRVALDRVGATEVSTVFLGLDLHMDFYLEKPHDPLLWETMIFGGPYDLRSQRYTSKKEALEGHKKLVQMLTS